MADQGVEGEALRKLVKLGKRKTLSFAFCPGPKNEHLLLIDKRKKPEVIAKVAKRDGAGSKVACGTFEVNGRTLELTCERVVPALAKILKKYLKSQKLQLNILVMDETGAVLERDEEDLPEDPAWEAEEAEEDGREAEAETAARTSGAEDGATPAAAGLAARLKAVQPALAAAPATVAGKLKTAAAQTVAQIRAGDLAAAERSVAALEKAAARLRAEGESAPRPGDRQREAGPSEDADETRRLAARAGTLKAVIARLPTPAKEKLTAALTRAAQLLKAGKRAEAGALLDRIEAAVNKVQAAPPRTADRQAAKWRAAAARLQPEINRLVAEKRGDLATLNRFFAYATEQAEAGNFDKALAAAGRVAALIKAAASAETTAAAEEARAAAPDNVAAYTRSRLAWIETRDSLRGELAALKAAIDAATEGVEGMEDVPSRSGILFDYLDGIDSRLEDTMELLVETPDGDRREALKKSARKIIDEYRGVLDTDFFKAVDDNAFARTNIRVGALAALREVSTALDG